MKHNINLINHQVNDEYYTPPILVELILPYVKKGSTVWCPFDTADSEFVIQLKREGHNVINTHIIDGFDFFELMPPKCDYIISNPPFSCKIDIFKRLFKMGIPFAMVMNVQILNSHETGNLFKDFEFELLLPTKRISFTGSAIPFLTCYICYKMLPQQIKYVQVEHTNIGRHFVPSNMLKVAE
jgi:hypothetical protein